MTVKEILSMLVLPSEVNISWNGDRIDFNFHNSIEVDAWGNYVVGSIYASKEGVYELAIAAQPIKREAAV